MWRMLFGLVMVVVMGGVVGARAQGAATGGTGTSGAQATGETVTTTVPKSGTATRVYESSTLNEKSSRGDTSYFDEVTQPVINGHGFDVGNNGTSAEGWTSSGWGLIDIENYTRGIGSILTGNQRRHGKGDTVGFGTGMYTYGGETTASDEGVVNLSIHNDQMDYTAGTITDFTPNNGAGTGPQIITTALTHGKVFNDGAILIDATQKLATATITAYGRNFNGMYFDVTGAAMPASTAWGNIVQASCTGNGDGQWQRYTSTTCDVRLATGVDGPGSRMPGKFVVGHIYLSGPFAEEAEVTAAGEVHDGVQRITFKTRYAWDSKYGNKNAAMVMQGGPGGEAMVDSSAVTIWPIAYMVMGATSEGRVYFSNCAFGQCNGVDSSNLLKVGTGITFFPAAEIIGTGPSGSDGGTDNVAELATNHIQFAKGDLVVSTPAAEYLQHGARLYLSQRTPGSNSMSDVGSVGAEVDDAGQSPIGAAFAGINHHGADNASLAGLFLNGGYTNLVATYFRPTKALIYVLGNTVGGGSAPYSVFMDAPGSGVGGNLVFAPATGVLSWDHRMTAVQLGVGRGNNYGQLNVNDSGTVTQVNKTATAGPLGVAAVVAAPVRAAGLSAGTGGALQCGGAVCPAGMYRVTMYGNVTGVIAGGGSGTLTLHCGWNDGSGMQSATSAGIAMGARGSYGSEVCNLYSAGNADITYSTSLTGVGQYAVSVVMERLD